MIFLMMAPLVLFMDRVDTLDTLLFGKNKNKNIFFVMNDLYCKYNTSTTSKSIKKYFFLSILRVSTLSTLSTLSIIMNSQVGGDGDLNDFK
jgi:hypothetical protein